MIMDAPKLQDKAVNDAMSGRVNRVHLPERGEMGGGSHLLMIDYRHRQGRYFERMRECKGNGVPPRTYFV